MKEPIWNQNLLLHVDISKDINLKVQCFDNVIFILTLI
jgi:hypothetical protein